MTTSRNLTIDIVRVLCTLEIVAFWHMLDYYPNPEAYKIVGGLSVTDGVLSAFAFISGLFLGKQSISPLEFYAKRIKRFLLLFAIALGILYAGSVIESFTDYVFALTGISCFIEPMPKTLWFFTMMVLFYWITPLICLGNSNKWYNKLLMSIAVYAILLLIHVFIHPIDYRVLLYFPFYVIGIICPLSATKWRNTHSFTIIALGGAVSFLNLFSSQLDFCIPRFISCLFSAAMILGVGNIISNFLGEKVKSFITVISYACMCAYLFHRPIYEAFQRVFENEQGTMPIYLIPIMIITLFIISYYIQKAYDKVINIVFVKKNED